MNGLPSVEARNRSSEVKSTRRWSLSKVSTAVTLRPPLVNTPRTWVESSAVHRMGASRMAPGANTTRSLNTVTVSPWSISGPAASTTGTMDITLARIVALAPMNWCRTVTGRPDRVASMMKARWGRGP
ncbi:hypothetical protein EAH86_15540 [Pedococcus bigeumensis]|uniref:Uncharacterized protein n=1 Tax=Pedococcus bigeumensis TaxID=433644 RepID=A0A502CQZ5_9MICO|nr:hypothetical protein EAH86_15540 [Pedococcus bigeumensis]